MLIRFTTSGALIHAAAIEDHDVFFRLLLFRGDRHRNGVAEANRFAETQVLSEIERQGH